MGTVGTFDTFTTARLGIYAAQKGLSVTGNNVANISTDRYTRQRVDQVSLKTGANDMYRSQFDNHVGNGVLITGISQIRDPYLDIRFRNTSADVGFTNTLLSGLQDIAAILDEVGSSLDGVEQDGRLYAQLQDLRKSLNAILADPTKNNDYLARSSAQALASLFNDYANKLENLKANTISSFEKNVTAVNEILTNIRNLNESIRQSDIHGDPALEMRDERNRQIDELSQYMHIKVTYSMEDLGAGMEVEKLTISLGDANPDPAVTTDSSILVDGIFGSQISVPKTLPVPNPDFDPVNGNPYKDAADLTDADYLYLKEGGGLTNDPAEAQQADNKNYLIQISKLLDSKEQEWTNSVTSRTEVPADQLNGAVLGVNAVYTFTLDDSTGWEKGDTFTIGTETYTVGTDIPVKNANDKNIMASFIAAKLNRQNDDYKVSAKDGLITFTAKNAGAVDPADAPNLTFTPAAGVAGSVTFGARTEAVPGVDAVPPAPDSQTVNPDGSETSVIYRQSGDKWMKITTTVKHTAEVTLDDNDLHGSLQATRELLTEKGEFSTAEDMTLDEKATGKRGIPYYQKSLDLLARQVAQQYNSLNQGFMVNEKGNYIDDTGKELMLAGDDGVEAPISKTNGLTASQKQNLINNDYVLKDADGNTVVDENGDPVIDLDRVLTEKGAMIPEGSGVLFSNRGDGNDDTDITAANITVSHDWLIGDTRIVTSFVQLFGEDGKPLPQTTQVDNVGHMLAMIDKALVYDPKLLDPDAVGNNLFTGSFNDMYDNMCGVLGDDQRITNVQLSNAYSSCVEIDSGRESVSGVDLNDEAMNMMQYQKAYSAACRLMTAIDEALDRLINNTGLAGR